MTDELKVAWTIRNGQVVSISAANQTVSYKYDDLSASISNDIAENVKRNMKEKYGVDGFDNAALMELMGVTDARSQEDTEV